MNRFHGAALFLCGSIPPLLSAASLYPQSTPPVKPSSPVGERYLYVWDNAIPGDATATQDLLAFAAKRGIDAFFLDASPVGYQLPGAQANYASFVASAHASGLRVFALGGYWWWTTPCGAGIPGQTTCYTEGWDYYESIASSGVPFDGILDDSEPYATDQPGGGNYFWDNLPSSAQQYLDFLHGVRSRIGSMTFFSTVPYWYDENSALSLVLDGEPQPHPLNWYTSRIVNVVQVLDYRDHAAGPGGLIEHAQGEIATGPSILGVETSDLGPGGDSATFWEEGRAFMEGELFLLWQAYRASPNFGGLAIHDYDGYRLMPP